MKDYIDVKKEWENEIKELNRLTDLKIKKYLEEKRNEMDEHNKKS